MAAFRTRSAALPAALLLGAAVACIGPAFVAAPTGAGVTRAPAGAVASAQPWQVAGGAVLLAAAPMPAHAGGMFDFGLTLPFVAVTFLTMMTVLNALFYAPVGDEMEDRNKKLLQTLSDATDMLSKADEIQVEYTEQIRVAREKASEAVKEYREKTEAMISSQIVAAASERDAKAKEVRARLEEEVAGKKAAAEAEIEQRKAAFVKETLAAVSL